MDYQKILGNWYKPMKKYGCINELKLIILKLKEKYKPKNIDKTFFLGSGIFEKANEKVKSIHNIKIKW